MLRRKMAAQTVALIVSLLLISTAALWGIHAVTQDFGIALRGYEQLRGVYDAASSATLARHYLSAPSPDVQRALEELRRALLKLQDPPNGPTAELRGPLSQIIQALSAAAAGQISPDDYVDLMGGLDRVRRQASELGGRIRHQIQSSQRDAQRKQQTTTITMLVLCAAIILSAALVAVAQYRGVMRPLNRLSGGVRRLAGGDFALRLEPRGAGEFIALAADFNRMAEQLEGLYRDLEQKVAAKSQQLVRSERLASVGYLAAGVAHEINNPLGIISGHAELALRQLEQVPSHPATEPLQSALNIICEEAFRCKDITTKLLSLARPGQQTMGRVALSALAAEVAGMLGGLRAYRDIALRLLCDPDDRCAVLASEGQMKQVLLNLVLNALEAVSPPAGSVQVEVRRTGDRVELSVSDNGRGMDQQILEHIFEPFFTDKRGTRSPGTGLGLSISHAIVEAHGGSIRASSEGPGRGSRFVVELPAATS